MLCVTCSDLFSVKASAYSGYLSNTTSIYWNNEGNRFYPIANYYNSNGGLIYSWNTADSGALSGGLYEISKDTLIQNCHGFSLGNSNTYIDFVYAPDVYKYYFVFTVYSAGDTFTFYPDSVSLGQYTCTDGTSNVVYSQTYMNFDGFHFDAGDRLGFSVVAELPSNLDNASISNFHFYDFSTGSFATWAYIQPLIISVPVGSSSDSDLSAIVSAIQDQTDEILSKFDEVLTPDGDHNFDAAVDNINDQINENMGALGFAHDTVTQFADLFTETPGAPVITVPPLKMSIKGQEYEFFHGYSYDFRSMETGPLAVLIGAVRTTGTIALWLAFLYYCNNEFNNFFRR